MNIQPITTPEQFELAYNGAFYTITGVEGKEEYVEGYNNLIHDEGLQPVTWYEFTGKDMNEQYQLRGDNVYQPDLQFLAFDYDKADAPKLAIVKLRMQDRWFNDIVDNNAKNN